jgi:alpha-ketoglutarate-dependent taurine dioxygenase
MTICTAEKLDVTYQLKKGEQIVDIWHNVRLTHSNIHAIRENTDRITEIAKLETEVFVLPDGHSCI